MDESITRKDVLAFVIAALIAAPIVFWLGAKIELILKAFLFLGSGGLSSGVG